MTINELFNKYVQLCEANDVDGCGDLVRDEEDETCKILFDKLSLDPRTREKLVKTLWYNYTTQKFRW